MKRMYIILAAAAFLFAGCSDKQKEEPEIHPSVADLLKENVPVYEDGEAEHYTIDEWADLVYGKDGANADESAASAKADFKKRMYEKQDSLANVRGENAFTLIFGRKTFNYQSVDENGNPITLSAFLGWGEYWLFFNYYPLDQDNIRLVCPYTHTKESECATADGGGYEFTLQTFDELFIMPDGEGFGVNKNHDQLYLNHNVQARQLYDALAAGYEIYTKNVKGDFEDDWHLHVIGASQGAADAIAVHKLLDTHSIFGVTFGDLWHFNYSYVCCGPYCPEVTMERYYSLREIYYPLVLPLTIKSMRASYPWLAEKYPEERFYTSKYTANMSEWNRIITNKELTADDLNSKLFKALQEGSDKGKNYLRIENILSAEVLDETSEIYKDFISCLKEQDLTSGWTPKTKSYVYYSKKDEVVPYENTRKLLDLFGSLAKPEEAFWDDHVDCCTQFMLKAW